MSKMILILVLDCLEKVLGFIEIVLISKFILIFEVGYEFGNFITY